MYVSWPGINVCHQPSDVDWPGINLVQLSWRPPNLGPGLAAVPGPSGGSLWVRVRVRVPGIFCWHVRVLKHNGQNGWRDEDPPADAVLITPVQMGPQPPAPRGAQSPVHNPPRQPDWARYRYRYRTVVQMARTQAAQAITKRRTEGARTPVGVVWDR